MEAYQQGGGGGRMEGKVQGIRSLIGRYKIDRDVKKSVGNGEAKELNMHNPWTELRRGLLEGRVCWVEGAKRKQLGQL